MAVEILAAEYTQGQLEATDMEATKANEFEDGKVVSSPAFEEQTKLGPVDGPVGASSSANGEKDVSADKFPKDAADEWPAQKEIHTFYFVKFRYYEDPKLKGKMEAAEKELQKRMQARYQLTELLKAKKTERFQIIDKLKPLSSQRKEFRKTLDEKRKEMEPLQAALGKLRNASSINREKGVGLCSSEEELNERIQSLQYRIQHESNTLAEEKQLLKEIKQLEGTREKVIAHVAMQAKIQDSYGQKEVIQDHVKLIGGDMDEVRKEQQSVDAKIKHHEEDLKAIDKEISSLQEELNTATERKGKAYASVLELRKQRDEGNASYFQYRSLQTKFRELAAKKDKAALEEISHTETEKFMALWNSSKKVRDDYEKKLLPSLDSRQLSRDGRMRNPDEKPLVSEEPALAETATAPAKGSTRHSKDDTRAPSEHETPSANKVQRQKEENKKSKEPEVAAKERTLQEPEIVSAVETHKVSRENEVDAAKLKELKRQEEIAKAKLALERKKKLAEKAAAKAAARAQKDAEKKLQEREKKARKKAGAVVNAESDDTSEEPEATTAEDAEEKVEVPAPPKDNTPKETVRFRGRTKGPKPVPKSILKKKQASSYWLWVVPSVILALVLLALVLFYFLQKEPKN
ncbi:proton pump-interactor 1-like isoform X2 [Nymphaea colorata]|nr:proton pump-interactor 1-like isoform X2 [Nymphaea colorata]